MRVFFKCETKPLRLLIAREYKADKISSVVLSLERTYNVSCSVHEMFG
jgi:hypothetical protein